MKIVDDTAAARTAATKSTAQERQDARWLGDLERAWLATWSQSSERQAGGQPGGDTPGHGTGQRPGRTAVRVGTTTQEPAAFTSATGTREPQPQAERAPSEASPSRRQADRTQQEPVSHTSTPASAEVGALAMRMRLSDLAHDTGSPSGQGPDGRSIGLEAVTLTAAVDEPANPVAPPLVEADEWDAQPSPAALPILPMGGSTQSSPPASSPVNADAVVELTSTDAGARRAPAAAAPPVPTAQASLQASAPPTSVRDAIAAPGLAQTAVQAVPQRVGTVSEEPEASTPSAAAASPPESPNKPPEKTSLHVATSVDAAVVMLRDAGLAAGDVSQVARMLAMQMQQLGFSSIRTYVNGVVRQVDGDRSEGVLSDAVEPSPSSGAMVSTLPIPSSKPPRKDQR